MKTVGVSQSSTSCTLALICPLFRVMELCLQSEMVIVEARSSC